MPTSSLPATIRKYQNEILQEWMKEQVAASSMRSDLISEEQLRQQSTDFLQRFQVAVQSGEPFSPGSAVWTPVAELLSDLSRTRGRMGFSPSETAGFIFSLKPPLLVRLRAEAGSDSTQLFADFSTATELLDKLGVYTTELYQEAREEVIRQQQLELLELSTPVVKLWQGVVALPLIGTLDSSRTGVVMENLLQEIVRTGSEIAILDITGVPTVDTLVAQHLLKTVAAARLMGADCIISGIRPQIAQTMVHLGIDLSSVTTKATLAEALRTALARTGYTISRVTA